MNKKVAMRIGAALVDIVIVVLILFSIIISISSITAKANNGVPDLFGYSPFSVQSDSMEDTFSKGDYIFVEACDGESVGVGDVVTFFTFVGNERVIKTHRIVNVFDHNGVIEYQTQGDNELLPDEQLVAPGDVIGKYTNVRIPLLGTAIDFMSTRIGFFLVILLPVLLFTLFQIYKLVMVILHNHKVDLINSVNENTSDEVKEAIIAEYLAKQNEVEAEDKND